MTPFAASPYTRPSRSETETETRPLPAGGPAHRRGSSQMRRLTYGLLLLLVLALGAPAQAHALTDTQLDRCRSLNAALDATRNVRGMRVLCQVGADIPRAARSPRR